MALSSFVDQIAPTGFWQYSPDAYILYSGYCSIFLLKLIDSEFPYQFNEIQKERIIDLTTGLMVTLSSPGIVVDERHAPKLFTGLLAGLLKRVETDVRMKKRVRASREKPREQFMDIVQTRP